MASPNEIFTRSILDLPLAPTSTGLNRFFLLNGDPLHISGHSPLRINNNWLVWRVGQSVTTREGKQAALQVGQSIMATINTPVGSLNQFLPLIEMVEYSPQWYLIENVEELETLVLVISPSRVRENQWRTLERDRNQPVGSSYIC